MAQPAPPADILERPRPGSAWGQDGRACPVSSLRQEAWLFGRNRRNKTDSMEDPVPYTLIVDDEPAVLRFLESVLARAGWSTDTAKDGVEAVLKVMRGKYDAVLMDIRMPRLNGTDALRIIREFEPDLPVVMFTGHASEAERYEVVRCGASRCLLKPVKIDSLIESLRVALLNLSNLDVSRDYGKW